MLGAAPARDRRLANLSLGDPDRYSFAANACYLDALLDGLRSGNVTLVLRDWGSAEVLLHATGWLTAWSIGKGDSMRVAFENWAMYLDGSHEKALFWS